MNPIISVVVPTKNRYKYLKHLITFIDSFKSKDIELVVQDNSDSNKEIIEFLDQLNSPVVKYFYCSDKLSMSANADLAVKNSNGEYVCFIGDDDGVTSHIIACTHWMKENNIDALSCSLVNYYWSDYPQSLTGNLSNFLIYKDFSCKYEYVNPYDALNEVVRKGFQYKGDLPFLYTGIVKRSILDQVYNIGGTYFPGPSPDMANGVCLCFFLKTYVKVDFPVVITGISHMTGGGINRLKGKIANIEDVPFISSDVKEKWDKRIPKIWAAEFAWPESGLKALNYVNEQEYIKKVNFEYMLANFMVFHFSYRKLALSFSRRLFVLLYYFITLFIKRYFKGLSSVVSKKLFNKVNGRNIVQNVKGIENANHRLIEVQKEFVLDKM